MYAIFKSTTLANESNGISTIVSKYTKDAFSIGSGLIKVTLNFNFERDDVVARKHKEKAIYKLTIKQKKILELLKGNGELTQKELSDKTSVSLAGVKRSCKSYKSLI